MNRIWSCFRLLSLGFLLSSMSVAATENIEGEKALLQNIFPSTCHFSGQFTQQKDIDGLPMPLMSTGDFYFSCGLGLIWNTESPFKEVLLFANSSVNFRIDESENIEPLSGAARYAMSKIFLRLLKGDVDYFAEEFAVKLSEDELNTELRPESAFMKKGIDLITIAKSSSGDSSVSLDISIRDVNAQITRVRIDKVNDYEGEGRREGFEKCEEIYQSPLSYCRMLRSPWRYEK